ncbi:hypothetical protein [Actinocrispum wychmicini]|uniref:Phage terminase large subunit-like protein n=1 Tax=Actinocrispum wychmicini TaxID=1213861 RepID=A0A4R2JIU0_9PSEU|nr:hypothetical protein [Actinocrispum wychmicini]TCO56898.1 phage terminase large subunit-like protein [Actinocrispum wychmicini]
MQDDLLLRAPSHVIGPTWRRLRAGGWHLPERSLGWGVINWLAANVLQPGGPRAGKPFLPTLEQARFLVWWYAVDERGRFVYRSGLLRRLKGWGKDPLAAAMSLVELCGPVAFSHWDNGTPVGKLRDSAWIQIAAVSQDQTRNTFSLFPAMASKRLREAYGLEINRTIIYSKSGGMIEGVTSSPLALEGKRPTFVVKNETQWWIEANAGHTMSEVIAGNVDKAAYGGCRSLSICNAHVPGQDSDAERDYDVYQAVQAGQALDTGFLYDSIEAPADTPVSEILSPAEDPEGHEAGIAALRAGLEVARGDAVWLDLDTIVASILDIKRPLTESRRKFLNQVNAAEDAWIAPYEWDRIQSDVQLAAGERVTLGFDGSKSRDHTALVACRVSDGALFSLKVWNPELYGGEVPRDDVDATVRWAFSRFEVVAFRADVKEFESYVDSWTRLYHRTLKVKATPGHPIAFDMRGNIKRFALDCERFLDAVLEGELAHDGAAVLRQHVLNAHRHPTTYDAISIRKASKDSSRKIDAAVCAVLAFGARQDFLISKKNRSGKAVVFR